MARCSHTDPYRTEVPYILHSTSTRSPKIIASKIQNTDNRGACMTRTASYAHKGFLLVRVRKSGNPSALGYAVVVVEIKSHAFAGRHTSPVLLTLT